MRLTAAATSLPHYVPPRPPHSGPVHGQAVICLRLYTRLLWQVHGQAVVGKLHLSKNHLFNGRYLEALLSCPTSTSLLSILVIHLARLFIMNLGSFALALAAISTALLRSVSAVEVM
jgi:hypothetical protein